MGKVVPGPWDGESEEGEEWDGTLNILYSYQPSLLVVQHAFTIYKALQFQSTVVQRCLNVGVAQGSI